MFSFFLFADLVIYTRQIYNFNSNAYCIKTPDSPDSKPSFYLNYFHTLPTIFLFFTFQFAHL